MLVAEFRTELRKSHALLSILLFVLSASYIAYVLLGEAQSNVWLAIFWLIVIFSAVQAVSSSFFQLSESHLNYLRTTVSPSAFILSKIIFNSVYLILVILSSILVLSIWLGQDLSQSLRIFSVAFLTGLGFTGVLSLSSAIAISASNRTTLVAILAFPLLIPLLSLSADISTQMIKGVGLSYIWKELAFLSLIDILVIVLSIILVPFLWRT